MVGMTGRRTPRAKVLGPALLALLLAGCSSAATEPIAADATCEEMAAMWQSEKDTFDTLQLGVEQAHSKGQTADDLIDGQERAYDRMNALLDERERRDCV